MASDDSYGIQVAKLANLPDEVINRAQVILDAFEQSQNTSDNEEHSNITVLKDSNQSKGLQMMTHKMQTTLIKSLKQQRMQLRMNLSKRLSIYLILKQ